MAARVLAELEAALAARERAGLLRRIEPRQGLDFVTNDYLGFAAHPALAAAMAEASRAGGAGARAARLLGGDTPWHRRAEAAAAAWLGAEAALLFPSGSQANHALLGTVLREGDVAFSDERNHASLVDALRLARGRKVVFSHGDARALGAALAAHRHAPRRVIVTDAVFSMTGARAPLADYAALAEEHDAALVVDEAHAAGVLGPRGAGLAAELGLASRVLARVVTGGKALGVSGAFVAGPRVLVDAITNFGRGFLFTTAPPPAVAAGLEAAIALAIGADPARARLREAASRLRKALRAGGIPVECHESPIVFVSLGEPARATSVAAALRARGLDARAVRPPTVPRGESGLRLAVHADHSDASLASLAREVARAVAEQPIPPAPSPRPAPRVVAVVGTDTGVGKTVVAAALTLLAAERGDARYWKPVQTGSGADDDTATARRLLAESPRACAGDPNDAFPEPVAPHEAAARAGARLDPDAIVARAREEAAAAGAGTLVIEAAGGLLVPLDDARSQDWVLRALGAPVVLVARTSLGTLNHTRLTLEALAARGIPVAAVVLSGESHPSNEETLARFAPPGRLFRLPRVAPLDASALAAAARASGLGRILEDLPPWAGIR